MTINYFNNFCQTKKIIWVIICCLHLMFSVIDFISYIVVSFSWNMIESLGHHTFQYSSVSTKWKLGLKWNLGFQVGICEVI